MSEEKTMRVGNKQYIVPDEKDPIREILSINIDKVEQAMELKCAKIEVVFVAPKISTLKLTKVVRSNNELKFFSNFDYLIEISSQYWDKIDPKYKEIIILHALEQAIPITDDAGETKYTLKKKEIIDMPSIKSYGTDWFKELETAIIKIETDALLEAGKDGEKVAAIQEKLMNKGLSV
jgi:hypothetical protein